MYAYTWVAGFYSTYFPDCFNVAMYAYTWGGDEIFLLEEVRSAKILVYILNFADMCVEKIISAWLRGRK